MSAAISSASMQPSQQAGLLLASAPVPATSPVAAFALSMGLLLEFCIKRRELAADLQRSSLGNGIAFNSLEQKSAERVWND